MSDRSDMEKQEAMDHRPTNMSEGRRLTDRTHVNKRLVFATVISYVTVWNMGYNNAIIASTLGTANFFAYYPEILTRADSTSLIGCIVCMTSVGGAIGVIINALINDKWGRKVGFITAALFSLLGVGLTAGSRSVVMLIIGRFILFLGGWGGATGAIIYVQELAPTSHRGEFGSGIGPCLNSGYMVASWVQVGFFYVNASYNWRMPLFMGCLPGFIMLALVPFIPESPRWLIFNDKHAEALSVFKRLHGDPVNDPDYVLAREEHYQVSKQVALDKTLPSSWLSMFTRYRKRTGVAILVPFNNQILGPQIVTNYGVSLYTAAGLSGVTPLVVAGSWYVVAVSASIWWASLVDKVGRKMLIVGGTVMTNFAFVIITALYATYVDGAATASNLKAGQSALIFSFFFFVIMYEIGEPAMFLYLGEIFPTHIRAKGVAIALCSLNVTAAWLTMVFPVGLAAAGWKFLLLNIALMTVCAILQFIFLKESRGVPLEEMARIWGHEDEVAVLSADVNIRMVEASEMKSA